MAALILIVDDSPDVTQVVAAVLKHKGYDTMIADGGASALALMAERRPDLIICDILMPEMDGFDVFQRVRTERRWRTIPFVFLTALTDARTRLRSNELGVEAFITKPFRHQDLLAAVAGLLRRAEELHTYSSAELETFKAQLLFMFTQELNTPLSVIRMLTDNMRGNLKRMSQAQLAGYLDLVARSTDDLSYIVETMLLAIQIDTGRAKSLFDSWAAPCRVRPMLEDIVAAAQTRLAERLVTVTVVNGNGHYQVRAHEEQLRQVFSRLLDNAIRFSPKGGHVTVRIMRDGETIRIAVADQGVGMTPEQVEMAFDRMRQINRAEQQQQGIGMSLSLIRSLVEIHGGTITSESVPGHGTTFTVALPRVEPQD